jgi:hypothetical protein
LASEVSLIELLGQPDVARLLVASRALERDEARSVEAAWLLRLAAANLVVASKGLPPDSVEDGWLRRQVAHRLVAAGWHRQLVIAPWVADSKQPRQVGSGS